MLTTAEHVSVPRVQRSTIASLRLRLKSAHRTCGFVQGAWWPWSARLAAELPSLLGALSLRFGPVDRVRYHQDDWSPTPSSLKHEGGEVILDASQDAPSVITVFGKQFGRLALLVVPPYTSFDDANTAMTRAATVGNVCTPNQLLGLSADSGEDRYHAPITRQRRERGALRWSCRGPRL
nr:DUF5994 family protein [Mycobacterium sp. 852002-51163_SCH5372311]